MTPSSGGKAYRLLIDLDAVRMLQGLPKRVRVQLYDHFEHLRLSPDRFSDYQEPDETGRLVEITVFGGYSIHYWIDFPDRHVKVLSINLADR